MSGPRRAEDRLRRLLVMLPWLMEVGEVSLSEVAARFEMTETEVQKELELVAMCGLPPFVDEMIDLFVDDGMVFVGVPRLFTRPLRLTAPEAFSLLTSARAAMELPGADRDGSLGRGLTKLASALDDSGLEAPVTDVADVVIDIERPPLTDALTDAVGEGAEMRMRYYTPSRDEVTERLVIPRHVFVEGGNWYLVADDVSSDAQRTFRIDRIEEVAATGRLDPVNSRVRAPDEFFVDFDVPRAVIRLAPGANWVVESYPSDKVKQLSQPVDWVEVTLPVSSERWLSRLLIRLGPEAKVVEPADAAAAAAALAGQILARYET